MSFKLNADQQRAATQLAGPVLVTAGAGSGKTRVLTERFANAVVNGRLPDWDAVDPQSVVAITYTEKAAHEIAQRVQAAISSLDSSLTRRSDALWISTIHGFCARILRRYPFEAGIDPLFTVADNLKSGRLRERAFRDALVSLDARDASTRELLDAYGEDHVFSAVRIVSRELTVGGIPGRVEFEPALALDELVSEARTLFADGLSACEIDYRGTSTTHIKHSEACRELLDSCEALDCSAAEGGAKLECLRSLAHAYEPINRLKGFEDLREEMCRRKRQLHARISAAAAAPHAHTLGRLVSEFSSKYAALKESAGVLDFEDLQVLTLRLLECRPDVVGRCNERFKVVMVDEFQDTDALQLRLVELVAGHNLCTVGDEMQSIYGFRGADVEVYRDHRCKMAERGALSAELSVNYRSHPEILAFVNSVFQSSAYRRNEALVLSPGSSAAEQPQNPIFGAGPRVEVLFVDSDGSSMDASRAREAADLADRLAELVSRGVEAGDMAILLRAYTDAHLYADELARRGVHAVIVGGSRFFELGEIAVMRALTRVIANVGDEAALGALLVSDFTSVSDDALLRLRLDNRGGSTPSLWALICGDLGKLDLVDAEALMQLRSAVESARGRVGKEPLEDTLLRAVEEAGYDIRLLGRGAMGRDAFANVLKFVRKAAEFESAEGSGPAGFIAHLDDKERLRDFEAPDSAGGGVAGAVQIMSIHASKGLEFPVVAVPDIGRRTPSSGGIVRIRRSGSALKIALKAPRKDGEGKAPEESPWFEEFGALERESEEQARERLFYVALTRAKELLLVSGSGSLGPRSDSGANTDFDKLLGLVGRRVAGGEESDEVESMPGGARCRVRFAKGSGRQAATPNLDDRAMRDEPLCLGEPLADARGLSAVSKTISYTQLSEFASCPRRYQIRRVLGLMPLPAQAAAEDPTRFGNALHAVLRLVSPERTLPSTQRMVAIAQYFGLDEEHGARLVDVSRRYVESDVAKRAAEADVVLREASFSVAVDGGRFHINGSIDLYARDGDSALIIDYKSGASGDSEGLTARYQLQAACYALAALRDGRNRVEVVFVRPEVVRNGTIESVSYRFDTTDATSIETDLARRYSEIEDSAFPATPGVVCAGCDVPVRMCDQWANTT